MDSSDMGKIGGARRSQKLTKARRVEIARSGGLSRAEKLTPAKRRKIARNAGRMKGRAQ